ncbi:hypothetical protein B0H15DRAFT_853503 [Mycena belliarum]|uniref:TPR-like protein n=1 Tax=Mycena belliarum TaxID=1033014 RepID=A0AAD6XKV7_9AGAR|nr:hypothetical protein B0H15DRAFT_853503 [Mycena belliae]
MSSAESKAQGNALFNAKKFKEAGEKYTEAIQVGDEATDPKGLAVIYANRAACRLSLKRYLDACADAKKATELDPTYAKAFARLATAQAAMSDYPHSEESWQHALDALPKADLKPAEQVQRQQYQAGLEAATAAVAKMKSTPIIGEDAILVQGEGRMPWDLAAAMIPDLRIARSTNADRLRSSAWVVHSAYEDFMSGINKMKQLKHDTATNQMMGMPGAITDLTNGLMRDIRVLHFTDNNFISLYNKQVIIEIQLFKPWTEGGPELVIRESLERQRTEGWDSVRPAISLTIRAWIMRAVIDSHLRQQHAAAVEFLKRGLDVLRSLRDSWILVPKTNRGVVFEQSFLFGLQNMYIEAMMQTYSLKPSPELLEELSTESDLLIREVDAALRQPHSQGPVDPGFMSSFYLYPRGMAYAMKGFCFNKKAGLEPGRRNEFHRMAGITYIKAADCFPEDDEHNPWFLNIALGNMFQARTFPLRETLDVMKRIRLAAPKAKEIWERSSLSASGLWDILGGVGEQETFLRDMLAQGKFTLDSCVGPATDE